MGRSSSLRWYAWNGVGYVGLRRKELSKQFKKNINFSKQKRLPVSVSHFDSIEYNIEQCNIEYNIQYRYNIEKMLLKPSKDKNNFFYMTNLTFILIFRSKFISYYIDSKLIAKNTKVTISQIFLCYRTHFSENCNSIQKHTVII